MFFRIATLRWRYRGKLPRKRLLWGECIESSKDIITNGVERKHVFEYFETI